MHVELSPYRPSWPARFDQLGSELRAVFGPLARRIDHIGSTAVPGLAAKPIIDVQVSVTALDVVEQIAASIAGLGFEFVDNDDRRKRYARRRGEGVDANLHIRSDGEFSQQANLLLRDHLRAEPSARERYEQVKRELAERAWDSIDAYADAKGDIVWQLLREADRWGWSRPGPQAR